MRHDIYTLPQITLVGGQSETIRWRLFDLDGEPYDASGVDARFALVDFSDQAAEEPVLAIDATINTDQESGVDCIVKIVMDPDDTIDLYGKYIYQITLKGGSGYVQIPNQGIMFIAHNIDRDYLS
jgi:hypothetical protein